MTINNDKSAFSLWMQAVRPFSFTASVTPVLLGSALAYFEQGFVHPLYLVAAAFGGLLLHAGTNLVSEYFDLKIGADKKSTYGSSRVLVDDLMEPKKVLTGGLIAFGLAVLIGVYLLVELKQTILWFGLAGLAGGYFYTGAPFGYKYRALGEPLVFLLMGPLMVLGGYFVQTGTLSWTPIWVSIPVGMLVAAILLANNLRDIPDDKKAGFHTIATLFGWKLASRSYQALIAIVYVVLVVIAIKGLVPWWALIALITIIPSLKLHRTVWSAKPMAQRDLATLDVATAQLHFQFGILVTISLVIGKIV